MCIFHLLFGAPWEGLFLTMKNSLKLLFFIISILVELPYRNHVMLFILFYTKATE